MASAGAGHKAMEMITLNKMLLCTGLAVLLLTMMKIASAQPLPADMELGESDPAPFDLAGDGGIMYGPRPAAVPAELLLSARGFAIRDNETRILEMAVERMRNVDPSLVRRLLSSNKSLEEIKGMIRAELGEATCRGAIRLDRRLYVIFNIRFLPSGKNTTLDADVAAPGFGKAPGNETGVVGHITVTLNPSLEERIGWGRLMINGGQQTGSYEVLLETWTDGQMRREMVP